MKNKIYLILSLLIIGGVLLYNYIYQDHRDISQETATYEITATKLVKDFVNDISYTQNKYLNKTIEVTGTITANGNNSITLNNAVYCTFSNSTKATLNTTITIKGRFIGYDDLLEEVKLDQCTIKN